MKEDLTQNVGNSMYQTLVNKSYIFAMAFLLLGISCIAQKKTNKNESDLDALILKDKKVLIVYGGWSGHKPGDFVEKTKTWMEAEGAILTLSDSTAIYKDLDLLMSQDLIIQSWTTGKIERQEIKNLLAAVKSGVGFAGCHGGIGDSFRENTAFQYLVGGQFVDHPGGQVDYTVNMRDKKDEITKGLGDFSIKTEQYYMHIDPIVKVLATTEFSGEHDEWIEGVMMPVLWKKYFGKGRVFYFSVGHNMEDFDIPECTTILKRGFRWAGQSKYLPKEQWTSQAYK